MKISTIIPVYNTEKYIKRCLDSIINQTIGIKNIEIIIVDDGSTDKSVEVIEKYTKKYENIKYYYEENGGQAQARNKGLSLATGEYISFVDSDDWIESDMYESLFDTKYDIITCDYTKKINDESKYVSFRFCEDDQKNFIIMNTGPCNMIIRRSFLESINFKFKEGIIYEDLAIIPLLGIYTDKIKYIESSYYNYYIRSSSTMNQKVYSNRLEDIFKSVDILYDKWHNIDINQRYYDEIEYLYIRRLLMSASLRFIEFNDPNNCIKKISAEIKEKFPNWKKNKYYKKLRLRQRIVAIVTYYNLERLLRILYLINSKK